jgi:hypothetical protein
MPQQQIPHVLIHFEQAPEPTPAAVEPGPERAPQSQHREKCAYSKKWWFLLLIPALFTSQPARDY